MIVTMISNKLGYYLYRRSRYRWIFGSVGLTEQLPPTGGAAGNLELDFSGVDGR